MRAALATKRDTCAAIMSVSCTRGSRIREILFECSIGDENEFSIRRRLGARTKKIFPNPIPLYIYAAAN